MSSLIDQIQSDAIDPKISVSDLLRKVKLAAAKLKLENLEGWVDHELKGYGKDGEVPEYRKIRGNPMVQTLYHGMQPLQLTEQTEFLNQVALGDPISMLEHHIAEKNEGFIRPYPPAIIVALNKSNNGVITQGGVSFSTSVMVKIVDTVRTLVLEWANKMEKAGVTGDGLKFTDEEKKIAASASPNIFNIGNIGNFTGVIGAGNITGDITSSAISIEGVRSLVAQLGKYGDQLVSEGVDKTELNNLRQKLESALAKDKPDETLLTQLLRELSDKLKIAASSVVAQGLITIISRLLGLPAP